MNKEIQKKLEQLAKDQSKNYLHDAETTYKEKMKEKTQDAQDDLYMYMIDYMNDLLSKGMDEEKAYQKVSQEIQLKSGTTLEDELKNKYQEYYQSIEPAQQEVVGLYYGGFIVLFMVIGALTGFLSQGGVEGFFKEGWIYSIIYGLVGILCGTAFGMISQAIIVAKKNK